MGALSRMRRRLRETGERITNLADPGAPPLLLRAPSAWENFMEQVRESPDPQVHAILKMPRRQRRQNLQRMFAMGLRGGHV